MDEEKKKPYEILHCIEDIVSGEEDVRDKEFEFSMSGMRKIIKMLEQYKDDAVEEVKNDLRKALIKENWQITHIEAFIDKYLKED